MPIEDTKFGSITIDGKTYEHDVIVRLSGKVEKRKKKLSKETYGTSHIISKDEAKFVFEDGCDVLIVGAGQEGKCACLRRPAIISTKSGARSSCSRRPKPFGPSISRTIKRSASCM